MTELASWAVAKVQVCDICRAEMVRGKEHYHCRRCQNARQIAVVKWLRRNLKRA